MNNQRVRWSLGQGDIGDLSMYLKPIRTRQEVSEILGLSPTVVTELEASGLRKIIRALTDYEKERKEINDE